MNGIWWAIGRVSTEGSEIETTTDAGRAIAIVLILTGIGVFSVLTGAVSQHFITNRETPHTDEVGHGQNLILSRLDELAVRLEKIEGLHTRTGLPIVDPTRDHAGTDMSRIGDPR
jgi:hypothetical protein